MRTDAKQQATELHSPPTARAKERLISLKNIQIEDAIPLMSANERHGYRPWVTAPSLLLLTTLFTLLVIMTSSHYYVLAACIVMKSGGLIVNWCTHCRPDLGSNSIPFSPTMKRILWLVRFEICRCVQGTLLPLGVGANLYLRGVR